MSLGETPRRGKARTEAHDIEHERASVRTADVHRLHQSTYTKQIYRLSNNGIDVADAAAASAAAAAVCVSAR